MPRFLTKNALVYARMPAVKAARVVKKKPTKTSAWLLSTTGTSPTYHNMAGRFRSGLDARGGEMNVTGSVNWIVVGGSGSEARIQGQSEKTRDRPFYTRSPRRLPLRATPSRYSISREYVGMEVFAFQGWPPVDSCKVSQTLTSWKPPQACNSIMDQSRPSTAGATEKLKIQQGRDSEMARGRLTFRKRGAKAGDGGHGERVATVDGDQSPCPLQAISGEPGSDSSPRSWSLARGTTGA